MLDKVKMEEKQRLKLQDFCPNTLHVDADTEPDIDADDGDIAITFAC